jgi:hypothetical protein
VRKKQLHSQEELHRQQVRKTQTKGKRGEIENVLSSPNTDLQYPLTPPRTNPYTAPRRYISQGLVNPPTPALCTAGIKPINP